MIKEDVEQAFNLIAPVAQKCGVSDDDAKAVIAAISEITTAKRVSDEQAALALRAYVLELDRVKESDRKLQRLKDHAGATKRFEPTARNSRGGGIAGMREHETGRFVHFQNHIGTVAKMQEEIDRLRDSLDAVRGLLEDESDDDIIDRLWSVVR